MACATCVNRQEHPLWRPSAECKCRACSRLWYLRTTFMFWGPSPLCLACAMSGDADNCREALDAAPARWTAFRTALQKHFKVAPDLYFVQMLPCIWRHFVRMATRRRSTGQVTWKTVARQSVESLWQQESIRFEVDAFAPFPAAGQICAVAGLQKALVSWFPGIARNQVEGLLRQAQSQ